MMNDAIASDLAGVTKQLDQCRTVSQRLQTVSYWPHDEFCLTSALREQVMRADAAKANLSGMALVVKRLAALENPTAGGGQNGF